MSTFLYRGIKDDGYYVTGSCFYNSISEVDQHLKQFNLTNIEIYESKTQYKKSQYSLVSANELSIFCKQISAMVFSYITIIEGISLLSEQTENKTLKIALAEIHNFLEKGFTFSQAISMYEHVFGKYLVSMTIIGEQSGNIETVYNELSIYFEKEHNIRKKIKSAILYPASLSAITLLVFAYMAESILPIFDSVLESLGEGQSAMVGIIMKFNRFLDNYFILIMFFIFALVFGIYFYSVSDKGKYKMDKLKATLPYISYINNRITTARFSRSLSMMLKSGVDLYNSLNKSTILITNIYLLEKFKEATEKVKEGETLSKALEDLAVFPSLFVRMVTIGEKSGNLDEMLEKTTTVYEEEAYDLIERATKLIEPILISFLAIVLGFILLTIMLPMITIMNTL